MTLPNHLKLNNIESYYGPIMPDPRISIECRAARIVTCSAQRRRQKRCLKTIPAFSIVRRAPSIFWQADPAHGSPTRSALAPRA